MPSGQFSRRVARVGGNDNAFTTTYHQQVARELRRWSAAMEADRMQALLLDPATPETERGGVILKNAARWSTTRPAPASANSAERHAVREPPAPRDRVEHEIRPAADRV